MKHNVYIFGEMHTTADRDRVEKEIIELHKKGKIKFLLTEENGDYRAFDEIEKRTWIKGRRFSISDRSYRLALKLSIPVIGIDTWDSKVYAKDKKKPNGEYTNCVESFKIREEKMVATILEFGDMGGCAVIVGDSHLRGLPNPVMGDVSPIQKAFLNDPKVSIFRSPISELNENGLVKVQGESFNEHVYKRLIELGNILVDDQKQHYDLKRQVRGALIAEYYEKDDFIFPDKTIYCHVINNVIVSMAMTFLYTPTFLNLGPIVTDPAFRGKGLVTGIFKYLFETYPKTKYAYELGVYPGNASAVKLYEKLGFKTIHLTMGM